MGIFRFQVKDRFFYISNRIKKKTVYVKKVP